MKTKLILTFEKALEADDIKFVQNAMEDKDQQALDEIYGVGWDAPTKVEVIIGDDKK